MCGHSRTLAISLRRCAAQPVQEAHLHPVPISFQVDESSPRIEDWRVQNIEYCNQVGSALYWEHVRVSVFQFHVFAKGHWEHGSSHGLVLMSHQRHEISAAGSLCNRGGVDSGQRGRRAHALQRQLGRPGLRQQLGQHVQAERGGGRRRRSSHRGGARSGR